MNKQFQSASIRNQKEVFRSFFGHASVVPVALMVHLKESFSLQATELQ